MRSKLITKNEVRNSPAEMLRIAVEGGADLEKLKSVLDLQERWEANEARKAYAKAFATAQANMLPVIKRKINKQTSSSYAELADIIETSQPIYTKDGFSVTFNEGDCPKQDHARIIATVLHCLGHKEQYYLDIPLDGAGIKGNANMTAIHGKASSVSYGKKYLMCMIWNIPTQDNDGNPVSQMEKPKSTENQNTQAQVKTSPLDACMSLGIKKLGDNDKFKAWRVDNKQPENLKIATPQELKELHTKLLSLK